MPEEQRPGPPWARGGPPWARGGPPWGGGRPPWWPENEPWPPTDASAWRRHRPAYFARRIGFAFALFFMLLFLTSALAVAVLSGLFGLRRHHGLVPLAAVLGVLLLFGLISLARGLRRLARPLGEVRVAADRVAGGDYSVRVQEHGPREMRRLIDEGVAAFASQAQEQGVALGARAAGPLPELSVDPVRIGEVMSNLLANAMRHTPSGGSVTVTASPDGDRVAFAIADTGRGIAPEQLPHVFDRYVKGADSLGSGLGLAIARTLVEAHGGEITAESDPGRGTTIRFTLRASG